MPALLGRPDPTPVCHGIVVESDSQKLGNDKTQ
jgi:hypothetical protein